MAKVPFSPARSSFPIDPNMLYKYDQKDNNPCGQFSTILILTYTEPNNLIPLPQSSFYSLAFCYSTPSILASPTPIFTATLLGTLAPFNPVVLLPGNSSFPRYLFANPPRPPLNLPANLTSSLWAILRIVFNAENSPQLHTQPPVPNSTFFS